MFRAIVEIVPSVTHLPDLVHSHIRRTMSQFTVPFILREGLSLKRDENITDNIFKEACLAIVYTDLRGDYTVIANGCVIHVQYYWWLSKPMLIAMILSTPKFKNFNRDSFAVPMRMSAMQSLRRHLWSSTPRFTEAPL